MNVSCKHCIRIQCTTVLYSHSKSSLKDKCHFGPMTANSRMKLNTCPALILNTDGCFTELLLSDLIGNVCSHEDRHGDAQLPSNDLRDQLQTLWTCINALEHTDNQENQEITVYHERCIVRQVTSCFIISFLYEHKIC